MEIAFTHSSLMDRCEQLSSFEADGKFDANGESRFMEIHINSVDKLLVQQYITQARLTLEERIQDMITSSSSDTDGFTWVIREDTRWGKDGRFAKHCEEAIIAYAMAEWLRGKLDDRVPFYERLFNNSLNLAVKNIFTKQEPT